MMLSLAFLALAAATPGAGTERADWYNCLERYSQVAMFSRRTAATLAMNALTACSDERKALQLRLLRSQTADNRKVDGPTFAAALADEDRAAAMHVIGFVNRYR